MKNEKLLLSGNEAVAYAAKNSFVALGAGYPGTPSTEILECFAGLKGKAQWAPNEKVALEVALGASFGGGRAIAAMKHVGINVASDPLFTIAYTGCDAGLVVISADDPGMSSSQNEQDNRWYALSAQIPLIEPSDSQEAYDYLQEAFKISEKWKLPVLFRLTTRVCHSKTIVNISKILEDNNRRTYKRDIRGRVMIPSNARPAHKRLSDKFKGMKADTEKSEMNFLISNNSQTGIITSGISYMYCREAMPEADILKLGFTNPLPEAKITDFVKRHSKVYVIEEGDTYLYTRIRALGLCVSGKPEMYELGELSTERVKVIFSKTEKEQPPLLPGKPPELCKGCPHRVIFEIFRKLDCIVSGDIGCYSLGALPPFESMDSLISMGAAMGVGLGLRHVLPEKEAVRVVSVIGDSTFLHSGITGLVEMVYNKPSTGHVVVVLDNETTAMTGLQEHPGTGRTLDHSSTYKVLPEKIAEALGIKNIHVIDPVKEPAVLEKTIKEALQSSELSFIVARRPCLLASKKIKELNKEKKS